MARKTTAKTTKPIKEKVVKHDTPVVNMDTVIKEMKAEAKEEIVKAVKILISEAEANITNAIKDITEKATESAPVSDPVVTEEVPVAGDTPATEGDGL